MSKGNPIVKVRITVDDLAEIVAQTDSRNAHTKEAPWTVSDWIRSAIREKFRKTRAGRKPRLKRLQSECEHGVKLGDPCDACYDEKELEAARLFNEEMF